MSDDVPEMVERVARAIDYAMQASSLPDVARAAIAEHERALADAGMVIASRAFFDRLRKIAERGQAAIDREDARADHRRKGARAPIAPFGLPNG